MSRVRDDIDGAELKIIAGLAALARNDVATAIDAAMFAAMLLGQAALRAENFARFVRASSLVGNLQHEITTQVRALQESARAIGDIKPQGSA